MSIAEISLKLGKEESNFLLSGALWGSWICFGRHPGIGVFSEVMKEMSGRLADFRREWWWCNANGIGCCLVNSMQDDAVGRPRRVAMAIYDSATNRVELTFTNQFVRVVQLS